MTNHGMLVTGTCRDPIKAQRVHDDLGASVLVFDGDSTTTGDDEVSGGGLV